MHERISQFGCQVTTKYHKYCSMFFGTKYLLLLFSDVQGNNIMLLYRHSTHCQLHVHCVHSLLNRDFGMVPLIKRVYYLKKKTVHLKVKSYDALFIAGYQIARKIFCSSATHERNNTGRLDTILK